MSRRRLAAVALGALALAWLGWSRLVAVTPEAAPESPRESRPGPVAAPDPAAVSTLPALPRRDLFRYGGEPRPAPAAPAFTRPAPVAEAAPTPPPGPRLVGFVRQDDRLRAAVVIAGRVVLVAAGEAVDGHAFLSVDVDRGVRVRGPGGDERVLEPR